MFIKIVYKITTEKVTGHTWYLNIPTIITLMLYKNPTEMILNSKQNRPSYTKKHIIGRKSRIVQICVGRFNKMA